MRIDINNIEALYLAGEKKEGFPTCNNKFGNLIEHTSDHDGTVRSARACFIIKQFNPRTGAELAKILLQNKNPHHRTYEDIEYPMFFDNRKLINYCKKREKEEWFNYCVSSVDLTDLTADIWDLSPDFRKNYPPFFSQSPTFGTHLWGGWHKALREVEMIMRG